MSDLISRQDAIALLEAMFRHGRDDWDAGADAAIGRAIEALTNMPSADTLATNEINALKDALAQAEGEIAELQRRLESWEDAAREDGY